MNREEQAAIMKTQKALRKLRQPISNAIENAKRQHAKLKDALQIPRKTRNSRR